jgi:hypothetical protein
MIRNVLSFCISNCIIFANDFHVEAKGICVYKMRVCLWRYIFHIVGIFFFFTVRCFCVQNKFLRSIIRSLHSTRDRCHTLLPHLRSSRQSSRPDVTDYSTMYDVHPYLPPTYPPHVNSLPFTRHEVMSAYNEIPLVYTTGLLRRYVTRRPSNIINVLWWTYIRLCYFLYCFYFFPKA